MTSSSDSNSDDAFKVIAAKVSALFAIGIISFLCGILPHYTIRAFRNRFPTSTVHRITSGFICFSGGTLLGVTFLHLMPEVREKLSRLQTEHKELEFPESLPLSDIIAMSGFFGVYLVDEFLHMCVEWYSVRVKRSRVVESPESKKFCSQLPHEVSVFSLDNHESDKHQVSICRRSNHHSLPASSCVCQQSSPDTTDERELYSVMHEGENDPKMSGTVLKAYATPEQSSLPASEAMSPMSGLITIAALSFHDIFEGIAIGIEQDLSSILFLYLSIASHKYAIAFCIGTDLVIAGSRLKMIVLSMMTFSVVSPVGVFIGMVVVAEKTPAGEYEIDSPTTVVMQGIAGGTLIYVVCFEVLQRHGTDTHKKGIQNVIFVISGFLVTLGFKALTGH